MYFQSNIFHGNNSPYIKLAFYSVSVRQGTYTRCRTNNKKKKRKNENAEESKTKEETDIVHYSTGTRLVSFHLSFPFTAKWVDRSHYYSPIYSEKNYPIFTIWTKKIQFVPLNVVDFLARSHRTKKSRLGRAREYWSNDKEERKKKKEINDTKDRSTFCQFWLERELTYEYSVRERSEVSARLDIQIILNAMCHIKFDVNYLLKPFCLFTR